MERDIYNIIRKELASLALFSLISYTELIHKGQLTCSDTDKEALVQMLENCICLGALDAIIHFLDAFHTYYSNKYTGEWMHMVVKCILSRYHSTVKELWSLNFNEAHAELCFEYDCPFILSFLLLISTVYKHLHFSQYKFIDEFWRVSPDHYCNNQLNPLSEFIINLAQYVNSGEVYGMCAKVFNRLCYNDTTAIHLSSLMENHEVIYDNDTTIANVFNIDIFMDIVKKSSSSSYSTSVTNGEQWDVDRTPSGVSSQFLCTFDYFVVNSFLKLLCNMLSYNCQLFYDIVENGDGSFLHDLMALYFSTNSIKIQTKILFLYRLFSRNDNCATVIFELLHEPSNQMRLYKSVKQNITVSLTGSFKFVREVITLMRFWIGWNVRRGTLLLEESRLFFEVYLLFLDQMFTSCELYNFKSELQQVHYVFECFGLVRDVLTHYQLKLTYVKRILAQLSYFNVNAVCSSRFANDIGLPYTDACLYVLMFKLLSDSSVIRAVCYLFVYNAGVLENINRQHEYFFQYCDIVRHCLHIFAFVFECEAVISPVISESRLPLPPKKFSLLLFSLADDRQFDVLRALVDVCCNKLLPNDIVMSALTLLLNQNIKNQTEIQSHLAQVSKLVVGLSFRISDDLTVSTDPQPSVLVAKNDNNLSTGDAKQLATSAKKCPVPTTITQIILELLFKMTQSSNKFTIAHVLLFGIKSSLEFFHLRNIFHMSIVSQNSANTMDIVGSESFFERSHIIRKLVHILDKIYQSKKQSGNYLPLNMEMMILRMLYVNVRHPSYGLLLMRYLRQYDFFYMPLPKMDYFRDVLELMKSTTAPFTLFEYMVLIVEFIRVDFDIATREKNPQRIFTIFSYVLGANDSILLSLFEAIPLKVLEKPQFASSFKCFSASDVEKLMSNISKCSTLPEYYLCESVGHLPKNEVVYFDENSASKLLWSYVTSPKYSGVSSTTLQSDICVMLQWIVDTNQIQRLDFIRSICLKSAVQVVDSIYTATEYFDDTNHLLIVNTLQQLTHVIMDKTRSNACVSNNAIMVTISYCIFRVVKFVRSLLDMYGTDNLPDFFSCEHLEVLFGFCTSFLKTKATIVTTIQHSHLQASSYIYATMLLLCEIYATIISSGQCDTPPLDSSIGQPKSVIHMLDAGNTLITARMDKIYRKSLQASLNTMSHLNCIGVVIQDAFNSSLVDVNQTMAITFLSTAFALFKNNHIWLFNMSQTKFIENIVNFVCEPQHKNYLRYDSTALHSLHEESVLFGRLYQSLMFFLRVFSSTSIGVKYLCDSGLFVKLVQSYPHMDYHNKVTLNTVVAKQQPRFGLSNDSTLFTKLTQETRTLLPFFMVIRNVLDTSESNVANVVPVVLELFDKHREVVVDILMDEVSSDADTNTSEQSVANWPRLQLAGNIVEILSALSRFDVSESVSYAGNLCFGDKIKDIMLLLLACYSSSKMLQKVCLWSNVDFGVTTNLNSVCWGNYDLGLASKIHHLLIIDNSILKYFCQSLSTFDSHSSMATMLNRSSSVPTYLFLLYPSLYPVDGVEVGTVNLMRSNYELQHFDAGHVKVNLSSNWVFYGECFTFSKIIRLVE